MIPLSLSLISLPSHLSHTLLSKDASNFDAKGEYIGEGEPVEETPNATLRALGVDGCSCSRSHCTSRHCECMKAGRRYDPRKCMCQGCQNCPAKKSARKEKSVRAGLMHRTPWDR